MAANQRYRKPLPGTDLEYYDARAACEDIQAGSYDKLPYTSRILAENLVNRADKVDLPTLQSWLGQLIEGKQEIDFPWYPARWCAMIFWGRPRWWIWRVCAMRLQRRAAILPK